MAQFLLVSPRTGADVAAAEYRDVAVNARLNREDLVQRMLDSSTASIGSLDGFAGVIVGGSPFNVSDENKSDTQRHVEAQLSALVHSSIPVLFVCYGTGLVATIAGGSVGKTHPEPAGPTVVELTDAAATDPLCAELPPRFTALAGHTENVVDPGKATVLASGGCPVQILRYGETTWACQFHAEMDAQAMKARMDFYRDYGYFDPAEYDQIVAGLPLVDTEHASAFLRAFIRYCTRL